MTMKMTRLLFCLSVLMLSYSVALGAERQPVNVTGKWQLSWEARLGTERGTIRIEQADSKLSGAFEGRLGSPKVSGSMDGQNIILKLDFQGSRPFVLVFRGIVEGDRMQGKFDVEGVANGYDPQGENAHPTDYSWSAVRQPDRTQSNISQQNQRSDREQSQP